MATRTLNRSVGELASDPTVKLRDMAAGVHSQAGASTMPSVDGRWLAAAFKGQLRLAEFQFTVDTTKDDSGNVIADADDVDLVCGFAPKLAIIFIENGTNDRVELAYKDAPFVLAAIAGSATTTIATSNYVFGSDKFTLKGGATIAGKQHNVLLLG